MAIIRCRRGGGARGFAIDGGRFGGQYPVWKEEEEKT